MNKSTHNAQVPSADIDTMAGALTKEQRDKIRKHGVAERGLLIRVKASRMNNKRTDASATKEYCDQKSAQTSAVQVNKQLVSKKHLSPVTTAYNRIRDIIRNRCLPWDGTGWTFVPIGVYETVRAELAAAIAAKDAAVEKTAQKWEQVIEEQRTLLGDLFNRSDYPSPDEFRQAWQTDVQVQQIPTTDIRLDMDDDAVRDIANQVHKMVAENLSGAWTEAVSRLAESVRHASTLLKDKGSDSKRRAPIHDSLLDNLRVQVDVVEAMGFAGSDDRLIKLAQEVRKDVLGFTAETLRQNPAMREEVGKKADHLASKAELEMVACEKRLDSLTDELSDYI